MRSNSSHGYPASRCFVIVFGVMLKVKVGKLYLDLLNEVVGRNKTYSLNGGSMLFYHGTK